VSVLEIFTLPKNSKTKIAKSIDAPTLPRTAIHAQNPIDAEKDKNKAVPIIVVFMFLPSFPQPKV